MSSQEARWRYSSTHRRSPSYISFEAGLAFGPKPRPHRKIVGFLVFVSAGDESFMVQRFQWRELSRLELLVVVSRFYPWSHRCERKSDGPRDRIRTVSGNWIFVGHVAWGVGTAISKRVNGFQVPITSIDDVVG